MDDMANYYAQKRIALPQPDPKIFSTKRTQSRTSPYLSVGYRAWWGRLEPAAGFSPLQRMADFAPRLQPLCAK